MDGAPCINIMTTDEKAHSKSYAQTARRRPPTAARTLFTTCVEAHDQGHDMRLDMAERRVAQLLGRTPCAPRRHPRHAAGRQRSLQADHALRALRISGEGRLDDQQNQ